MTNRSGLAQLCGSTFGDFQDDSDGEDESEVARAPRNALKLDFPVLKWRC